jgi:protein-S-isoprenylcysteine O-methyltransferase Ste14
MLTNVLQSQGFFLFRWRSYLPLVLAPVVVISMRDADSLDALIGDRADDIFEFFCVGIAFLGLVLRALTVGFVPRSTSGRNTKRQKAAVLNTTGMYSIVRHPLYLANFLIFFGLISSIGVWYLWVIAVLAYFLYYERIMCAEEAFLHQQFGEAFARWAEKTPTFFPRFSQWREPSLPFSWITVVRREHLTVLLMVSGFYVIDVVEDFISRGHIDLEMRGLILSTIVLLACLSLRALHKHTTILRVEGR